jgi:hypothetical protein
MTESGASTNQVKFGYNANSQLMTVQRFSGTDSNSTSVQTTNQYDPDGRLIGLDDTYTDSTLDQYVWTFDNASRIATTTTSANGAATYVGVHNQSESCISDEVSGVIAQGAAGSSEGMGVPLKAAARAAPKKW